MLQSDPAAAGPALERGVTAARAAGQLDALSQSLAMSSIAANMAGDRASSRRLLDEARVVADGLDDLGATLMLHQARALNGLLDGDPDAVRSVASEGAQLSREAGDLYSLDMMLMNQGLAALMSGDLHESEQRFTEGLRIANQLDDRVAQCYLLGALGCCAAGSGEPAGSSALRGDGEATRRSRGQHHRGDRSASGAGNCSGEGGARPIEIRDRIQGRASAEPRCCGAAGAP